MENGITVYYNMPYYKKVDTFSAKKKQIFMFLFVFNLLGEEGISDSAH